MQVLANPNSNPDSIQLAVIPRSVSSTYFVAISALQWASADDHDGNIKSTTHRQQKYPLGRAWALEICIVALPHLMCLSSEFIEAYSSLFSINTASLFPNVTFQNALQILFAGYTRTISFPTAQWNRVKETAISQLNRSAVELAIRLRKSRFVGPPLSMQIPLCGRSHSGSQT